MSDPVFVLTFGIDYEGDTIGGVFATSDAAKASLESLPRGRERKWLGDDEHGWLYRPRGSSEYIEITRYEVQS